MRIVADLGVITVGIALAALIIIGLLALEKSFRTLEGTFLVVAVIVILASLLIYTIDSVYAFKKMISLHP